ncbi:MAG: DNA adenine methylase, partial [Clostridia bacterium]|nr:DNA adenine methylase [Clostridia bacterium]
MGNKTSILNIIYALFPMKYGRYIEPFGGSGAVLLGKRVPDKFEVYNDYNHNLVNLFRCMRDRPLEFIRELG